MKAEMEGRLRVIYAVQMEDPESMVISMPLTYHYDLQVRHPNGKKEYIEVKNRKVSSTAYPDVMFNKEKVTYNEEYGDDFYFVSTYTDNKALWFQPTTIPASGVTEREEWIKTTTIDPASPKKKQKRIYFSVNNLYKKQEIPNLIIKE